MSNRILRILVVLLGTAILALSCKQEEQPAELTVSQTEMHFGNQGGSQTLGFNSNVQWTATSSAEWCTLSPDSGDSEVQSTMVTATANTTAEERSATVTITAGSVSKKVEITQDSARESSDEEPGDEEPEDEGGNGTKDAPYLIYTAEDMQTVSSLCKEVNSDGDEPTYFKLMDDINLAGIKWEPINNKSPYARKIDFNGNGKTISNLRCSFCSYPSLFGILFGEVYDLKIADARIEGDSASGIVGGYAGTSDTFEHSAKVTNVHVTGTVDCTTVSLDGVGGLFGRCCNTEISRCSGVVTVKTIGGQVGGIVGYTDSGTNTISDCYTSGLLDSPKSSQRSGGIVGCIRGKGCVVENCISLCEINTNITVAGIVGHANENSSGVKSPGDVIRNCIAWNPELVALQCRQDQYSSGAVVGFTSLTNTLSNCWRRPDMVFTMNPDQSDRDKYPLDFLSLCDQPDASESSPLSEGVTFNPSDKQSVAPYNGKAAAAGETATQVAQRIGWSSTIWDFSGNVPVLKDSDVHGAGGDIPDDPDDEDKYVIPGDDIPNHERVTPEGVKRWTKNEVEPGVIYWSFDGTEPVTKAKQTMHVVDVDLNAGYALKYYYNADQNIASNVHKQYGAIATINGGLGASQIFIKIDGKIIKSITQDKNNETGVMNWRNDAAICTNPEGRVFIANALFSQDGDGQSEYGAMVSEQRSFYASTLKEMPNIISGSPLLIDGYNPLGLTYVPEGVDPQTYASDTEHPWYHQGVRHPRTGIAITGDNHLLLIVIDGRNDLFSKGVNAKEFTQILINNFDPKYAMNLDGGGSSTMCVNGYGDPDTHVVNYPCDNGKHDHAGERMVQTFLYIVKQ